MTIPAQRIVLSMRSINLTMAQVLITGASGGVGTAAVHICSQLGCHVIAATTNAASKVIQHYFTKSSSTNPSL